MSLENSRVLGNNKLALVVAVVVLLAVLLIASIRKRMGNINARRGDASTNPAPIKPFLATSAGLDAGTSDTGIPYANTSDAGSIYDMGPSDEYKEKFDERNKYGDMLKGRKARDGKPPREEKELAPDDGF